MHVCNICGHPSISSDSCQSCRKITNRGGILRVTAHVGKISGGVVRCTVDVRWPAGLWIFDLGRRAYIITREIGVGFEAPRPNAYDYSYKVTERTKHHHRYVVDTGSMVGNSQEHLLQRLERLCTRHNLELEDVDTIIFDPLSAANPR